MRVYRLTPELFFSGFPDEKTLAKEKFDTIVTLCRKQLPFELKQLTTAHLHIPLSDGKDIPNLENMQDVLDITVQSCRAGLKTLVHCYRGRNRSGLVATIALARLREITLREALEHVRAAHPGCLTNATFEEYVNCDLYSWQRHVRSDSA